MFLIKPFLIAKFDCTMKTIPDSSFHSLFMKFVLFTIDGTEIGVEVTPFCRKKVKSKNSNVHNSLKVMGSNPDYL